MSATIEELTQHVKNLEKAIYNLTMVIVEVRDLHTPYTYQGNEYCNECFDEYGEHAAYPCTTIDVLDKER